MCSDNELVIDQGHRCCNMIQLVVKWLLLVVQIQPMVVWCSGPSPTCALLYQNPSNGSTNPLTSTPTSSATQLNCNHLISLDTIQH